MSGTLKQFAKKNGVRFFLFNFTDLFGVQRAKLVPASAVADMEESGAGFAGFAAWLDMTPAHPDMFVLPDAGSVIQLPWKPEFAWVAGNPFMEGAAVAQAPRNLLLALTEAAADDQRLMAGVEPEFHLIDADGTDISDPRDIQEKPCYDQSALMRRYAVISEICEHMEALGWGPYQNDHEDANGQFEINWDYSDALTTADRHAFFKFMVKEVAQAHGFRATFMPKPFAHLTGNGCHAHLSLWTKTRRKNHFADKKDEMGLSQTCYHFVGGLMRHAPALAALTNPAVNSYKRINAPTTTSGATWSPNTITYGGNNRTHMIRIPDPGRIELRLADGAANPYLLMAGVLAAGRLGMADAVDPGKRMDIDAYAEPQKLARAGKLPLNLLDAIRALSGDKKLRGALGEEFVSAYVKLKTDDWNSYARHLTTWERDHTLDC